MKQKFKIRNKYLKEIEKHIKLEGTTKVNSAYSIINLDANDIVYLCSCKVLKIISITKAFCDIRFKENQKSMVLACNILVTFVGTKMTRVIEFKLNDKQYIMFPTKSSKDKTKIKITNKIT